MNWRKKELSHFGNEIDWAFEAEAQNIYSEAIKYASKTHYGLNEEEISTIEKISVEEPSQEIQEWLIHRIGDKSRDLTIVFGRDEVCKVRKEFFVENWQDIFYPARDDVLILPEIGDWVLFYCHEDEFEFGRRKRA
jgi:hypothetical protein